MPVELIQGKPMLTCRRCGEPNLKYQQTIGNDVYTECGTCGLIKPYPEARRAEDGRLAPKTDGRRSEG